MADRAVVFGTYRLIPERHVLLEGDAPVRLGSRAMDILIALVERAGEVVSNRELMARVWPNTVVEEANVRLQISALRRVLGDGREGSRYIKNMSGHGYCFVAPVSVSDQLKADLGRPLISRKSNLPAPITRIIGREAEVSMIADRLLAHRFISVIGPGGIGKTTAALSAAERLVSSYMDGVCFMDLAPVTDSRFVASALGSALGLSFISDNPTPDIVMELQNKHKLIVLDNCEHVIDACAALAETLLREAPEVSVLTTSREPLRAEGEFTHRLGPLDLPPLAEPLSAAKALNFSSIQLFVQRATAADDAFVLLDEDAQIVAGICQQLDGVPLAIEFAAARIDGLGVRGLAARIEDRFSLLMKGRRTALRRHQSMEAMLDWSYDRLDEAEQTVLCRLAVFNAPFTLQWAIAVAGSGFGDDAAFTDALSSLVAKSLVTCDASGPVARYRLLNLTRIYCINKLRLNGEYNDLCSRHATFLVELLDDASLDQVDRSISEKLAALPNAIDEVRAALDWAFSQLGDAETGCALTAAAAPIWIHKVLMLECRDRANYALSRIRAGVGADPRRDLQLNAALGVALLTAGGGASEVGEAWARAAELADALGDNEYRLRCCWGLWVGRFTYGDYRGALAAAKEFQQISNYSGSHIDVLVSERVLGVSLHVLGDQPAARHYLEHMVKSYVPAPDKSDMARYFYDQRAVAETFLAQVLWLLGLPEQAVQMTARAVSRANDIGHLGTQCYVLIHGACPIALQCGDRDLAERAIQQLLGVSSAHGPWKSWGDCYRGFLLIENGNPAEGVRVMREAASAAHKGMFQQLHIPFLGAFATGLALTGDFPGAFAAIAQAAEESESKGNLWWAAEILRIQGELTLLRDGGAALEAESLYRKSLDCSRAQGALSLELKTALSLAQLLRQQGRIDEAVALLTYVYGRFEEGFSTAQLTSARRLLAELQNGRRPSYRRPAPSNAARLKTPR